MMMLRHAATKAYPVTVPSTMPLLLWRRRHFIIPLQETSRRLYAAAATSREKRELNQQQLRGGDAGGTSGAAAARKAPTTTSAGPTISKASTSGPTSSLPASGGAGGGGGGVGGAAPFLAVLAVVGGGAAYYMGLIPGMEKAEEEGKVQDVAETAEPAAVEVVVQTVEVVEEGTPEPVLAEVVTDIVVVEEEENLPPSESESQPLPVAVAVEAVPPSAPTTDAVPPVATLDESKIMAALDDLKAQISRESDRALSEAHQELAKLSSLDMDKLDSMTEMQLKVRLVQMAKDIEERTKWEAVRLQQFLSMKEKEVEDRYVLIVKKLRLEAESLMEERLSQQERELTKKAGAMIQQQQEASDAFIESSLKIQEQSFMEEKAAHEAMVEEAMSAKYEELFGKSLAEVKKDFASRMDQKVKQMDALTKKLADLEFALQSSRTFQAGSVQAHRITAAAIALSEKLDSGEPAAAAMSALGAVASDNAVLSSAVQAIPPSVATKGVATVQQLQASFEEEVYPQVRRAISVPDGQDGLEGQILGMVFATLKYPPKPDDPAPESEKDAADYVLSRARRHVQLGEMEEAVREMDKLTGQAAFTAADWEKSVKDRVAVEKALKVILMECALANESLGNGPVTA